MDSTDDTGRRAADRSAVPLLLLDVDGVVNALGWAQDGDATDWSYGSATTGDGRTWPIRFNDDVLAVLRSWQAAGTVACRWLTTWLDDANGDLSQLLDLGPFPVLGAAEFADTVAELTALTSPTPVQGAGTAAAANARTGRWWKFDAVLALRRTEPARRLIWVDDDLADDAQAWAWATQQTDVLAVAPRRHQGLTTEDLDAVARFLGVPPGGPARAG